MPATPALLEVDHLDQDAADFGDLVGGQPTDGAGIEAPGGDGAR